MKAQLIDQQRAVQFGWAALAVVALSSTLACGDSATPVGPAPAGATTTGMIGMAAGAPAVTQPPVMSPTGGSAMSGGASTTPPPSSGTVTPPPVSGGVMMGTAPMTGGSTPDMSTMTGAMAPAQKPSGTPTLFWLDILAGGVYRASAEGTVMPKQIASTQMAPDGIAVDVEGGYVYWTNMGSPLGGAGNASLQRTKLDGGQVETVIDPGENGFNTGKQLTMDKVNKKLYFCDREGTTVWRANFDGSMMEPLARKSTTMNHDFSAPVGIAVDPGKKQFYFTDKDARKIRRANYEFKSGETAETRTDIEVLQSSGAGSGPIDLHLDLDKRLMYWTDRYLGQVLVAGMDLPAGMDPAKRSDQKVLQMGLTEPIGLAIDEWTNTGYVTQVSSVVEKFKVDGGDRTMFSRTGSTGITLVYLP